MTFTTPVNSEFTSLAVQQLKGHMSLCIISIHMSLHFMSCGTVMTVSLLTEVKVE